MGSLKDLFPEIAAQWHPAKNGDKKPEDYTPGSGKKVWWLCKRTINTCGCLHEWETTIANRTNGYKCPYCSHQKICIHQSIAKTHSEVILQWHPTKNGDLKPEQFSSGSGIKVWWLCEKKFSCGCPHEWESTVVRKIKGSSCPYCSHQKVCIHHSILFTHSKIAKERHPTKNGDLKPEQFGPGSGIKIWWLCGRNFACGCLHEWETKIVDRTQGTRCPYCCHHKICEHQSIKYTHPHIIEEWHPTKNGDLKPEQFSSGSGIKVWWLCRKCNNEWETSIVHRTSGQNCPYCCNKKVSLENSILFTHSEIAKEWHPTKNENLKPEQFSSGSGVKVWWLCKKCNNEWFTDIVHRCVSKRGCPICNTSHGEKTIREYLISHNINFIPQFRIPSNLLCPYDFLVNLDKRKILLEFDGGQHFSQIYYFYHDIKDFENRQLLDCIKTKLALEENYQIFHISYKYINYLTSILDYLFSSPIKDKCSQFLPPEDYLYVNNYLLENLSSEKIKEIIEKDEKK